MANVVFIALANLQDKSDGVAQKVLAQMDGVLQNGNMVTAYVYGNKGIVKWSNNGVVQEFPKSIIPKRWILYNYCAKQAKKMAGFSVYIRYAHCDFPFIRMLRLLKSNICKIFLEVPSFPIVYPALRINTLSSLYFRIMDRILSSIIKRYVYRTVSIGHETSMIFGIENINIPNGMALKLSETEYSTNRPTSQLHIIGVSSFYKKHGYDRLVSGLIEYYRKSKNRMIFLHLVGDGPEFEHIKTLISNGSLEKYVIMYGRLHGEEIEKIYAKCNMACGPLGLHRVGILVASPLKTKEYFMRGIPFLYSYKEIGLPNDSRYGLHIEENDNPVDFNRVLEYFNTYKDNFENISAEMKSFAHEHFKWNKILKFLSD